MQRNSHVVCFGEVLMDNLPQGQRIGGAPLNVCYHLNKHGLRATIVSQLGADDLGRDLLKGISSRGLNTNYIEVSSELPSSSVEVAIDDAGNVSYQILEPVAWDALSYRDSATELISDATSFVYGSLVARNMISRRTLYDYLEKSRWPVFDVNLRFPFFDRSLILDLIAKCKTLKVNTEELATIGTWLNGKELPDNTALELLLSHYPGVEEILLTRGAEGAVYKDRTQEFTKPAKPVKVKDTVGSGDAFLAGFLAKKMQGTDAEEALAYAISLSAYVAAEYGACPDYMGPLY